ncbi:MAG TPA: universal stress protein [Chitinophagaceae bacterium]|nr:universal stress protein [Chitinophagaceae bacterium]
MQKILIAINGEELNEQALNFACAIARIKGSPLTGIFLENMVENEQLIWKVTGGGNYPEWETDEHSKILEAKAKKINANIEKFRAVCQANQVLCKVHEDKSVPSREVETESRFADLLIVDACMSFKGYTGTPSDFVQQILRHAECPVIVAPESFTAINEIVFLYDGSKNAAYAIKQFTYLFPELYDKRVIVFRISEDGIWQDHERQQMQEWLQQRYSAIGFEVQKGDVKDKIFDYLLKRENNIIVMGSYGRTALSRFFSHSDADFVINAIPRPLFISHA